MALYWGVIFLVYYWKIVPHTSSQNLAVLRKTAIVSFDECPRARAYKKYTKRRPSNCAGARVKRSWRILALTALEFLTLRIKLVRSYRRENNLLGGKQLKRHPRKNVHGGGGSWRRHWKKNNGRDKSINNLRNALPPTKTEITVRASHKEK